MTPQEREDALTLVAEKQQERAGVHLAGMNAEDSPGARGPRRPRSKPRKHPAA
jgi:hypothetical protein